MPVSPVCGGDCGGGGGGGKDSCGERRLASREVRTWSREARNSPTAVITSVMLVSWPERPVTCRAAHRSARQTVDRLMRLAEDVSGGLDPARGVGGGGAVLMRKSRTASVPSVNATAIRSDDVPVASSESWRPFIAVVTWFRAASRPPIGGDLALERGNGRRQRLIACWARPRMSRPPRRGLCGRQRCPPPPRANRALVRSPSPVGRPFADEDGRRLKNSGRVTGRRRRACAPAIAAEAASIASIAFCWVATADSRWTRSRLRSC